MNTKSKLNHIFLLVSGGNIYFYSIYSLILFMSYFINNSGFPLFRSFLIFWSSVIITKILNSKKRYIYVILFLNSIGYFLASLWILSIFYNPSSLNSNPLWFLSILPNSYNIVELMVLILIFFGVFLLWIFGVKFGKKSMNYELTIQSFEMGIYIFFFVAMMTFFLKTDIPSMNLYLLTFFLWGTISVSLFKNTVWIQGNNKGNGGFRLIFLFIIMLSIFILSIITFFIDSLEWATVQGVSILKTVVNPISPYIIAVLRFLFDHLGYRVLKDTSTPIDTGERIITDVNSFTHIPSINFLIFCFILLSVFILIILFTSLLKLLFKKNGGGESEHRSMRETLGEVLKAIFNILYKFKNLIKTLFLPNKNIPFAVQIYSRLTNWGILRGISPVSSETPFEYAGRLSDKYEQFSDEFKITTAFFCSEIYGKKILDSSEIAHVKKAWKKVKTSDRKGILIHFMKG